MHGRPTRQGRVGRKEKRMLEPCGVCHGKKMIREIEYGLGRVTGFQQRPTALNAGDWEWFLLRQEADARAFL